MADFQSGRELTAAQLNALSRSASSVHPAAASYLATGNGSALALRSPRRDLHRARRVPYLWEVRSRSVAGGGGTETHAMVYLGDADAPKVMYRNIEIQPMPSVSTDDAGWFDAGVWESGDTVYLRFFVTEEAWDRWGEHAGVDIPGMRWAPTVNIDTPPSGYTDLPYLLHVQPAALSTWTDKGPLQLTRSVGPFRDVPADGTRWYEGTGWSDMEPRTYSIEETDVRKRLTLYGFLSPDVIGNPYADGVPTGAAASDYLLLVRVVEDGGSSLSLKYLPLSEITPGGGGGGGGGDDPYDPREDEDFDPYFELIDKPCPTNHDRTEPLPYFWNPCDLEDANGRVLQPAGWQTAKFWRAGGDENTCYGSKIGDSNKNEALDLDGRTAVGWIFDGCGATGGWSVAGNLSATGDLTIGNDTFRVETKTIITGVDFTNQTVTTETVRILVG